MAMDIGTENGPDVVRFTIVQLKFVVVYPLGINERFSFV